MLYIRMVLRGKKPGIVRLCKLVVIERIFGNDHPGISFESACAMFMPPVRGTLRPLIKIHRPWNIF